MIEAEVEMKLTRSMMETGIPGVSLGSLVTILSECSPTERGCGWHGPCTGKKLWYGKTSFSGYVLFDHPPSPKNEGNLNCAGPFKYGVTAKVLCRVDINIMQAFS